VVERTEKCVYEVPGLNDVRLYQLELVRWFDAKTKVYMWDEDVLGTLQFITSYKKNSWFLGVDWVSKY
jgi:hypothetical protein